MGAALAAPATGQDAPRPSTDPLFAPPTSGPFAYEVLDPGHSDTSPLSTSFRALPVDFALPTGFARVYRAPHDPNLLMRMNGALVATFPESSYERGFPVTPAGTVYHIGMPEPAPIQEEAPPPTLVDRRVYGALDPRAVVPLLPPQPPAPRPEPVVISAPSETPRPRPVTIATDYEFRRARLGALLRSLVPPANNRR